jgi:hypothetical protein
LLEQCATQRAGVVPSLYEDEPARLLRMLQAEMAGRELMAALVRPDPYLDMSLGAILRRLVGYVQTVLTGSTPDEQIAPLLTVRAHHVALDAGGTNLLRDVAILLVLAACDDGARNIDVRLDRVVVGGARLEFECDRPGVTAGLPILQSLQAAIVGRGGRWQTGCAAHGSSWIVAIALPAFLIGGAGHGEVVHGL